MRVGIFGGTFDPIHLGHLILAEQCREQAKLDQVWFIPSAQPPHKRDRQVTSFDRRLDMLQLAIAGHPAFQVNTIEKDRPGPSYTADTLTILKEQNPTGEFFLMVGADCLPDLPKWYEPVRILHLATLLVADRKEHIIWSAQELAQALGLADAKRVRLQHIPIPLITISSSNLRERAQQGQSLRYLVPHAVDVYIQEKRLYRTS